MPNSYFWGTATTLLWMWRRADNASDSDKKRRNANHISSTFQTEKNNHYSLREGAKAEAERSEMISQK